MMKFDIINRLIGRYGLTHFLEIATPTTGTKFREIASNTLQTRDRLMYRCPAAFGDGEVVTYRTEGDTSDQLVLAMLNAPESEPAYDIVFVDPFHTMACTASDLAGAWRLLEPGGWLVVHDCSPPDRPALYSPQFNDIEWCGLTYAAFVDFLFAHRDAEAWTVDTDYGCGVVRKPMSVTTAPAPLTDAGHSAWIATEGDHDRRYAHFNARRRELLNLVTVKEFCRAVFGEDSDRDVAAGEPDQQPALVVTANGATSGPSVLRSVRAIST